MAGTPFIPSTPQPSAGLFGNSTRPASPAPYRYNSGPAPSSLAASPMGVAPGYAQPAYGQPAAVSPVQPTAVPMATQSTVTAQPAATTGSAAANWGSIPSQPQQYASPISSGPGSTLPAGGYPATLPVRPAASQSRARVSLSVGSARLSARVGRRRRRTPHPPARRPPCLPGKSFPRWPQFLHRRMAPPPQYASSVYAPRQPALTATLPPQTQYSPDSHDRSRPSDALRARLPELLSGTSPLGPPGQPHGFARSHWAVAAAATNTGNQL